MEAKKQEFLQLVDTALEVGKGMLAANDSPSERLNTLIAQLQQLKANTISDRLEPSDGYVTLGLAREVADWIENLDSPLLKAVGAIEIYYQQQL
ncbi:hypothetical protein H6G33_03575 [Calothrix sp. FACHB-1219]|uniref:hypothetical protein n=1 Tax=unclassified Calothrix TaxID=2619626 RepID=UPI001684CF6D|nr:MULTISPECIES: hypothetical protein [unclassified Calothrix]MBD2202982.1 hypothetical protein [Calothrix sp. FACHB-168]MBD2216110.1 hypothetical protein [Calothrix sp. FACHB-1219]